MSELDAEAIVKSREKSRDKRLKTTLMVQRLKNKYIDVKRVIMDRHPEYLVGNERNRLSRVLLGITADDNVISILETLLVEFEA